MSEHADVIVVGGGLAGLVATAELADAGRRVLLLDHVGWAERGSHGAIGHGNSVPASTSRGGPARG